MCREMIAMNEITKIRDGIKKINYILTSEQKRYCILVGIMAILLSGLELLGVSVILPLMQAFLEPEELKNQKYLKVFIKAFKLENDAEIIVFTCIGIILIYIIKNLYGILYIWASNKLSYKIRKETSLRVLSTYMKQGYAFFTENNTARLIRGMDADVVNIYAIISQLFTFLAKGLSMMAISFYILITSSTMAIFLVLLILFCFWVTQKLFRGMLQKNGTLVREYAYKVTRAMMETLQGSKEILVKDKQKYFVNRYEECTDKLYGAKVKIAIGEGAPTYIIEGVCVSGLMIAVAFQSIISENTTVLLTQMAVIAVGAFRILPSLGALLSSINVITSNAPALSAAYETLNMVKDLEKNGEDINGETKEREGHNFEHELKLSHIKFKYTGSQKYIIDNLEMVIEKGSSIAFIGASGAGKTTLSDIILGLYRPESGDILMDGKSIYQMGKGWSKVVGYVPQSIYLVDSTVKENIAFGVDEEDIDEEKIWNVLEMAQLKEFIINLPHGINTRVGEMGVKFSGGQKQRIAIARALYEDPDILILDEATAALDTETEKAVMESIETLQGYKTLIIVAHRLSTIQNCDRIYEIRNGKAIEKKKEEIFEN